MSWSIPIGKLFGIPIRLHLTFLLLMGWLAVAGFWAGDQTRFLIALGLFGCVLLHELGHCVTALRFGVKTRDITLLPFGGLARIEDLPRRPRAELLIALAGPAVNFVLAPLFHGLHLALEPNIRHPGRLIEGHFFFEQLAILNLVLGLFNLIPAFPMDGGRVLRAILAMHMPYERATRHACGIGQLLAVLLGFLGIMVNPWLVLIALFVFMGASEELYRTESIAATMGVPVSAAAVTTFQSLRRADSVGRATELLLSGTQHDFPVVEDGQIVGVLTRRRMVDVLRTQGKEPYVSEVMEPAPEPVSPDTPLDRAMERLLREQLPIIPVCTPSGLYGLLTPENVMEFLMIHSALGGRGRPDVSQA